VADKITITRIIEVPTEEIPMSQAPSLVARMMECEAPSRQAVYQWAQHGRRAKDGTTVKLEVVKVGGRLHTTAEWLKTFIEAL
jgi:hypothetical protein